MRHFTGVQKLIRRNFYLYVAARRLAPFLCRYFDLEDGFAFLSRIRNRQNSVAVDIGSNDGTSIALISKNLEIEQIHCFDPVRSPIVPRYLLDRITYYSFALGDAPASLRLFVPVIRKFRLTQYSSTNKERALNQLNHDLNVNPLQVYFEEVSTEIRPLDELQLVPFFLKIDVEGDELKVLAGAKGTILKHLPIILVEIQSDMDYKEISTYLLQLGYKNFVPLNSRNKNWTALSQQFSFSHRYNNYLWLPDISSPNWIYK